MDYAYLFDGVINVIQSKIRSIVMVLSLAALTVPLGCAIPDMNQPTDTGDTNMLADGDGSSAMPDDGADTGAVADDMNGDTPDAPAAGDDTNVDTTPGDTDPAPGDDTTDPDTDAGTDPDTNDDGTTPPPGGGTPTPGGGDDGGTAPGGDSIRANLEFDGSDGTRVEMNPLAATLTGAAITPTTVTPATKGFITFLCDDTISLGDIAFFDAVGAVTTLNDVTFDRGTDFECGQTVTLSFSLPSDVLLISP